MKRTIVVGSAGQDGQIMSDRFRREGRYVVGIDRSGVQASQPIGLPHVDILDGESVRRLVETVAPDEIYYLAAYHHAAEERIEAETDLFPRSLAIQVSGVVNFLEALRRCAAETRFFYASSCQVFGVPAVVPQDETTPLDPDTAYSISKAAGMHCVRYYRQTHGLFAVSGILYNHESPLRAAKFVTQKIVHAAVAIRAGEKSKLVVGDLDAIVDWGYAPDYVDAMTRILAVGDPQDFIIATGEPHTVRDFAETAFSLLRLDWKQHVEVAPKLLARRPRTLVGNPARLREATGWKPAVSFAEMVRILVEAECRRRGLS